ncbi:MAG: PAS domain-containing protein [Taibaiella sp.]|nr:PAS domain-containing protein [Taibaiella sp.]
MEILKILLNNEMDLTQTHKQCVRLAEFTGHSLSSQTSFATAVSEVSRNIIGMDPAASISLKVEMQNDRAKYLIAVIQNNKTHYQPTRDEGYSYAKKLVNDITAITTGHGTVIELKTPVPPTTRLRAEQVENWKQNLHNTAAISPYEEIKRKNRLLVDMADRLRVSEQRYKSVSDTLPIAIFTMTDVGEISYANKWLTDFTGKTIEEINTKRWVDVIHPDDLPLLWQQLANNDSISSLAPELRVRAGKTGEYRWHIFATIAYKSEDGTF